MSKHKRFATALRNNPGMGHMISLWGRRNQYAQFEKFARASHSMGSTAMLAAPMIAAMALSSRRRAGRNG